jgi:hypothetical protein
VTANTKGRCTVTGTDYELGSFSDAVHRYITAPPEEVEALLRGVFSAPANLFRWFGGLVEELEAHTHEALPPGGIALILERFEDKWLRVAVILFNSGFAAEAWTLLRRFYQLVRSAEIEKRERFHKGTTLWWMARAAQALGAQEDAKTYCALALAEDIRSNPDKWKGLPAYRMLVDSFQIANATVNAFGDAIGSLLGDAAWNACEPELGWLRAQPVRRNISRGPLDFIKAIAQEFFCAINRKADTTRAKGDCLELLVSYLFASERGFDVLGPIHSPDSQSDVLVRNRHGDPALAALGDYILVECKNWETPSNGQVVREFAGRLRAAKCKTGVLASKSGITGDPSEGDPQGATRTILKEFSSDASAVLVLNETDMENLANASMTLALLLLERFERVRFDFR